ncbi:MAG: hypothetical protein Q8S47_11805, partial [Phenylobacterium sp.]|nr:hypothetical protein [Phenylobacterium sp.]
MQQALNGKQKTDSSPDGVIERCCGVIMPISATSSYDEKHWANVQKLIHRAIESAGLSPLNVWVNDLTDRISERIIGNIGKLDSSMADISDQNPSVMVGLGLRLASKKPTIVISSDKSTAPFDISDFHILFYPHDLNMIEMEEFLSSLRLSIVNKLESYGKGGYTPFLNQIVVDVISPS